MRGTVAVVTGGGRGIGEAVARAFAREGAALVVAARTASEVERVARQIRQTGGTATAAPTDVASPAGVATLVDATLKVYGKIDVLVNVAGILGPVGPLWEADPALWRHTVDVNLFGTFLCCRAVLPHMITRRSGRIINFSGGGGASPSPRLGAYGASKAGVVRMTETLAEEVKPFNIQVNAISPGFVDTRIQDGILEAGERAGEHYSRVLRARETGEGTLPSELAAKLAVWLASNRSGTLTGKLIAAPHDDWQQWDERRLAVLAGSPWLTLRRIDTKILGPLPDDTRNDTS